MDSRNFVIEEEPTLFTCIICNCDMKSYNNAHQHLNGSRHSASLDKYGKDLVYDRANKKYYCYLCECWISGYQNVSQHIEGSRHRELLEGSDSESSCASSEEEETDDGSEEEEPDPSSFIIEYDNSQYYCLLCDVYSRGKSFVIEHVATYKHTEAVQNYGYDIVVRSYGSCDCSLCECFISGYSNVYTHIMGHRHQTALTE